MEQIYLDMSGFWNITPEGTNGMVSITDDTKYRDESVAEGENGDYVSAKLIYDTFLATGKDYETVCADTERDNWKSAEEACEYGLIDKVITSHDAGK